MEIKTNCRTCDKELLREHNEMNPNKVLCDECLLDNLIEQIAKAIMIPARFLKR